MTDAINPALTGRRAKTATDWANTSWDEVAAFLGPNADLFRAVWEKAHARALAKGVVSGAGWSWPAFLFGFAWFFYRRMWLVGAVLLILPVVFGIFLGKGGNAAGVGIVIAIFAKSFVLQDAVTKIGKVRTDESASSPIRAAGGTSLLGGIVGGVLWLVILGSSLLTMLAGPR